jgi:acyl carrier protein
MDEVAQVVRQYIIDQFLNGKDSVGLTDTTPLVTGGILDSLASVNLVGFLERTYGIKIAAHEVNVDNLDTLALISAVVREKRGRE